MVNIILFVLSLFLDILRLIVNFFKITIFLKTRKYSKDFVTLFKIAGAMNKICFIIRTSNYIYTHFIFNLSITYFHYKEILYLN